MIFLGIWTTAHVEHRVKGKRVKGFHNMRSKYNDDDQDNIAFYSNCNKICYGDDNSSCDEIHDSSFPEKLHINLCQRADQFQLAD